MRPVSARIASLRSATVTHEYSMRLVLRLQKIGRESPEHRHAILTSLKQQLAKFGYTVDLCEMRTVTEIKESEP